MTPANPMSEPLQKVLHNQEGLEISFLVEDDQARVELRGNMNWDLSDPDDVVVVIDGTPARVESDDASFAVADLGTWSERASGPVSLMIRVHEFFDGWEFAPD